MTQEEIVAKIKDILSDELDSSPVHGGIDGQDEAAARIAKLLYEVDSTGITVMPTESFTPAVEEGIRQWQKEREELDGRGDIPCCGPEKDPHSPVIRHFQS